MAGYLDDSFTGTMLPAKREPIKAEVIYTPRKRRGSRKYKATVESPPRSEAPKSEPQPQADNSDAEFRKKALEVGKLNEKRRRREEKLQESQFQQQLRREAALAKRKQKARKQSIRKHKRIARKIWRRLI